MLAPSAELGGWGAGAGTEEAGCSGDKAPRPAAPPQRPAQLPRWKWAGPTGDPVARIAPHACGSGSTPCLDRARAPWPQALWGPLRSPAMFQQLDVCVLEGPTCPRGPMPLGSSPELRVSAQTNGGISGAREAGTVGPSALGPRGQCTGPGLDAHERASQPCRTSVTGPCPSLPAALTHTVKREPGARPVARGL